MLTANLFSLLLNLTCIGVVFYLIYLALKAKPKHPTVSESNRADGSKTYSLTQKISIQSFILYLKALKEEGKTTIDEVLNDLASKVGLVEAKPKRGKVTEERQPEVTAQTVVAPKVSSQIDTATLLLYLGAFVFLFAMLIFAGFTWSMYSVGFKMALILLIPVVFFAVAYGIKSNPKFNTAAVVFQTISAVMVGLAGVGIWNFTEISQGVGFWEYWLYYSVFVAVAYVGYLLVFKEKHYRYFILAALLSLIVSIAYAYANTIELRLLIIALLNISLYGAILAVPTLEEDRILSKTLVTVNRVVDIAIVLTLLGMSAVSGVFDQGIVVLALLVPFGFEVYQATQRKNEISSHVSVLSIVPKVFILSRLLGADTQLVIQLVGVSAVTLLALTELLLDDTQKELRGTSRLFHSTILGFLALISIRWVSFMRPGIEGNSIVSVLTDVDVLFVTLLASVGFAIPFKNEESKPRFGFALIPLIFGVAGLIPITPVITTLLCISIVSGILSFIQRKASEYERFGLISLTEGVLLSAAWLVFGTGTTLQVGIVLLIVAYGILYTRKMLGSKYGQLLVAPLLLVAVTHLMDYFPASKLELEYLLLGIPLLTYGVLQFLPSFWGEEQIGKGLLIFLSFVTITATYNEHVPGMLLLLLIVGLSIVGVKRQESRFWGALLGIAGLLLGRHAILALGLPVVFIYIANAALTLVGMSALTILREENTQLAHRLEYLKVVLIGYVVLHFWRIISYIKEVTYRLDGVYQYELAVDPRIPLETEVLLMILGVLTSTYALYIAPIKKGAKKYAGVGLVLSAWIVASYLEASLQAYIVPFTVYLGMLAYFLWVEGNRSLSRVFEFFAVFIQGSTLLLQSLGQRSDIEEVQYGIATIAVALVFILVGNRTERKSMYYLGIIFLVLELLVRLWFVIVLIPWWVYLAIVGLILMGAGLYAVWKKKE